MLYFFSSVAWNGQFVVKLIRRESKAVLSSFQNKWNSFRIMKNKMFFNKSHLKKLTLLVAISVGPLQMRRNHSKAGHKCYSIGSYWRATLSWLWLIKELATHSRMSKAIKCERKTIIWHKMSQACFSYVETEHRLSEFFCCISAAYW